MAVLNSAAIDVNFPFVSTAFGSSHISAARKDSRARRTHRRRGSIYEPLIEEDDEVVTIDQPNALLQNELHNDFEVDSRDEEEQEFDDLQSSDEESDSDSSSDDGYIGSKKSKFSAGKYIPCSSHFKSYQGHCNVETTKDVNFYGLYDQYVVSGSDCGNFFIWEKKTGRLVNILRGDLEVVNVIQPHPYEPMLAVSGIDSTVKIFSPDQHARRAAASGHGVTAADSSTFSSIRPSRRSTAANNTAPPQETKGNEDDMSDNETQPPAAPEKRLESRKRMHRQYQITSENDMERRSGMHSSYVSRSMMQLLMNSGLGEQLGAMEDLDRADCVVM